MNGLTAATAISSHSGLQQSGADPGGMAGHAAVDPQHEQAFADALQRSQPVQQMDARPATNDGGFMSGMTQRLDDIATNLRVDAGTPAQDMQQQSLFAGDPASASAAQAEQAKPPEDMHALTQRALETYRSTIVYSVEAQVATNGSSTSTKTFNDLMKGS